MVRALSRARSLLDGIPHRRGRAASSSVSGHGAEEAVAGYVRMLAGGARPDAYTFPSLLKAAAAARGAARRRHQLAVPSTRTWLSSGWSRTLTRRAP